jgi:hypothetical protein
MKSPVLVASVLWIAGSVAAAQSNPAEDIKAAAKKLGEKANYSWTSTVKVPEGAQFRPGPTEGKTEKDGFTHVTMSFGDNKLEIARKGDKAAVLNQEGVWQSAAELENGEGPARFLAGFARTIRPPGVQAAEIAAAVKEFKKDGDAWGGELTKDGAETLLRLRRGSDATVSNARGSAKFWLKDGTLVKFEFTVQGTVRFGDNDREVDRSTTVEIKDVGTTKLDVPDAAKKLLQ